MVATPALRLALAKHSRPKCETLPSTGAAAGRTLLVDGPSLQAHLQSSLGSKATPSALHAACCAYVQRLASTGLHVVVVVSAAAAAPGAEARLAGLQRAAAIAGSPSSSAAEWAVGQAAREGGCEVLVAAASAPRLLLAYARSHGPSLFALLTDDADFFVLGADKIALLSDAVVESCACTFYVWPTDGAWLAWRRSVKAGARTPSALQRAQVAVLLAGGSAAKVPSPVLAASLALCAEPEEELELPFFTGAAGAVAFGEAQLAAFRAAVGAFLSAEAASRRAGGWEAEALAHTGGGAAAPWLAPARAKSLCEQLCPTLAGAGASRGLILLSGAGWEAEGAPGAALLRSVRASAVAALLVSGIPPGDVFEFEPASGRLSLLLAGPPATAAPASWFDPASLLPLGVAPVSGVQPASPYPAPPATLSAASAALLDAAPGMPPAEAALYALLWRLSDPVEISAAVSELRAALGMSPAGEACTAGAALLDAGAPGAAVVAPAALALTTLGRPLVDVGSGLTEADYRDFDEKELVARTRAGGSFKVLQAIKPWSPEAAAAQPLQAEACFEYLYSQRKEHGTIWKDLAKACFPTQFDEAGEDKARKKYLKDRTCAVVLEELRKPKGPGQATASLLEALSKAGPAEQLLLRRIALRAGPGSVEWRCACASWAAASARTRASALEAQHACTNRAGAAPGAPPMRYKHQEELLTLLDEHLERSLVKGGGFDSTQLPLRVILSTPTGSGKTFTALMASTQLLAPKHPGAILVYSVPTKQVLKRVGQECEAANAVYWIAARNGDFFQVRRPYSIRTKRVKGEQGSGQGSMEEQLGIAHKRATESNDRGGGTPNLIVSDVYATAALCAYARTAPPSSPFHHSRLVLYLDEPNMGIHLSPRALEVVQQIMACAPHTAVLASATLPAWPQLPAWWRGDAAAPAQRITLTQPPYDLPSSRLMLLDSDAGELRSVSLLDLFPTYAAFARTVHGDARLRILLLRHLSPAQANALLAAAATEEKAEMEAAAAAAALTLDGGAEGEATAAAAAATAAAAADAEDEASQAAASWASLQPDVRTSRETLEAALLRLGPARFEQLRRSWREAPQRLEPGLGLRGALSTTGVTMVATLEPRRVALELAGWRGVGSSGGDSSGGTDWAERTHALKNRRREGSRQAAAMKREAERDAKRDGPGGDEGPSGPGGGGGDGAAGLELRPGLVVTHEEAEQVDDDTLLMLSRGVAFACADGSEGPLVKRLYQQALLHVPEDATRNRLPPIHALVVDYSSVYGTDCPAVDTLLLCDDLGALLTPEDSQQFLGRLRRDGRAVFLSARTLRASAAGASAQPDEALDLQLESLPRAVGSLLGRQLRAAGGGDAAALGSELAALRKSREPFAPAPAELARTALATILLHPAAVPPCPPGTAAAQHERASIRAFLERWAPSLTAVLRSRQERLLFLRAWEGAVAQPSSGGAAAAECAARLLSLSVDALKGLYDADVLDEGSLVAWAASADARGEADAAARRLLTKVTPFIEWLQEAEEDEDDEE